MFGWFKRREAAVRISDVIFMNMDGKYRYLLSLAGQEPQPVFVCWFEESAAALQQYFETQEVSSALVILPREVVGRHGSSIIFCEHHPSFKTEQQRFVQWSLTEAIVVSSLDEALFKAFGGDRIASLMKTLGMNEEEPISHPMVTTSIKKAQQKVDRKFTGFEQPAKCQAEWLNRHTG